jgi:hypothetical protein
MFCIFKLPKSVDNGNNPQMRNNAHRYQNDGMFLFNKLGVVIFLIQEYIYIYIKTIALRTFSYLSEPIDFYCFEIIFQKWLSLQLNSSSPLGFHKHNLSVDGLACGGGGC